MKKIINFIWIWYNFPGFILHEIGHFMLMPIAYLFTYGEVHSHTFKLRCSWKGFVCDATITNDNIESVYTQKWVFAIVLGPLIMYLIGSVIVIYLDSTLSIVYIIYSLSTFWFGPSRIDMNSMGIIKANIQAIKNKKYDRSTVSTQTAGTKESN